MTSKNALPGKNGKSSGPSIKLNKAKTFKGLVSTSAKR